MAINNPQTTLKIIEPLFYDEFNKQKPIFPEWTLERMPKNVNTRRIYLDEYKMSHEWALRKLKYKGKVRYLVVYIVTTFIH